MREMIVDISKHTINRMLLGRNYLAPTITQELEHHIATPASQRPWLARILRDDGYPPWL